MNLRTRLVEGNTVLCTYKGGISRITNRTKKQRVRAMAEMNLTDDDEGKQVVNSAGDDVGRITEVRDGKAYVNPDPGITDTISSKLGWGDADEKEEYELQPDRIETVTDDEIRLED